MARWRRLTYDPEVAWAPYAWLLNLGFVSRRKEGLYVYYALADARVFKLCDIMCARIESEVDARQKALAS